MTPKPTKHPSPGIDSRPAIRFLEQLKQANRANWLSRAEIWQRCGRGRFSDYHAKALESLVSAGLVEKAERTQGTFKTYFVYKITEKGLKHGES